MRALQRANHVRLARAELKRRICEGEIDVADVVRDCPWEAASMSVFDLLGSQRRWGRTRCRRVLSALTLSETKTIGSLTDRQRLELTARLHGDPAASASDPLALGGRGYYAAW